MAPGDERSTFFTQRQQQKERRADRHDMENKSRAMSFHATQNLELRSCLMVTRGDYSIYALPLLLSRSGGLKGKPEITSPKATPMPAMSLMGGR